MAKSSKVFISYAHGDRAYQDRVRAFADRLEVLGLETIFDQYEANPSQGWTQWMVDGIRRSDFVLCLCTANYELRINGDQTAGTGLGVQWEGRSLYNLLQSEPEQSNKVQVIQFDAPGAGHIPLPIRSNNRFVISQSDLADEQFKALYLVLTFQTTQRPVRGAVVDLSAAKLPGEPEIKILPPKERPDQGGHADVGFKMETRSAIRSLDTDTAQKGRYVGGKLSGPGDYLQKLARKRLKESQEAYYNDRYGLAVKLAEECHRLDGSCADAFLWKAESFYMLERWAEAVDAFHAYTALGGAIRPSDRMKTCTARYQLSGEKIFLEEAEALALTNTGDLWLQVGYSWFLNLIGRREQAKAWLIQITSQNREGKLLEQLAVLEWVDKNIAESTILLEEATKKDPSNEQVWAKLGIAWAEGKRFGLAIEALRRAQTLRPHGEFPTYALAEVYALMGDAEASVETLQKLAVSKSSFLRRLATERTFDPIRESETFQNFLAALPPDLD